MPVELPGSYNENSTRLQSTDSSKPGSSCVSHASYASPLLSFPRTETAGIEIAPDRERQSVGDIYLPVSHEGRGRRARVDSATRLNSSGFLYEEQKASTEMYLDLLHRQAGTSMHLRFRGQNLRHLEIHDQSQLTPDCCYSTGAPYIVLQAIISNQIVVITKAVTSCNTEELLLHLPLLTLVLSSSDVPSTSHKLSSLYTQLHQVSILIFVERVP